MEIVNTDKHHIDDVINRPLVDEILPDVDTNHTLNKSVIGMGTILMNDKKIDTFQNLVTLQGREFLTSKMTGLAIPGGKDYSNYKIAYFGVGTGGSDPLNPNTRFGPYDNDTVLHNEVQISATEINLNANGYKYMGNGMHKRLSEVSIEKESHHIHTSAADIYVDNYTTIKCVLKLVDAEPIQDPFAFSEASLIAYEYNPTTNKPIEGSGILVARFTTSTKELNDDELTIKWYVLV